MTIINLLKKLKLSYNNIVPYYIAFTHSTMLVEKREGNKKYESYERLEFVGDSLLSWRVSKFIYENFTLNEGHMSLLRAKFVKKESLANYSEKLKLNKCLIYKNKNSKLDTNKGVLADIFESFLAAIYMDIGIKAVDKILEKTVFKDIRNSWKNENKDNKTLLQEKLQINGTVELKYDTTKKSNKFESKIIYNNSVLGIGKGFSKKEAEQAAAKKALRK